MYCSDDDDGDYVHYSIHQINNFFLLLCSIEFLLLNDVRKCDEREEFKQTFGTNKIYCLQIITLKLLPIIILMLYCCCCLCQCLND